MKDARLTEFRGITYRSKSEAMFALWLEFKYPTAVVEYEPDWAELDDYVPDFVCSLPIPAYPTQRMCVFETWVAIIEYKPSRPTFTYLDDVSKKIRSIAKREGNIATKISAFVYWGSVYTEGRGVFTISCDGSAYETDTPMNWLGIHEKTIRDFRFDLEATPC